MEVASRRDFADVADAFVDAFFLDGQTDALDGSSRARLGRAALNDLEGRYSSRRVHGVGPAATRAARPRALRRTPPPLRRVALPRSRGGERALFVVRDDDGEVLACAGVEPQYFVGNAILVRAKRRPACCLPTCC